jgi:hypothetical protein
MGLECIMYCTYHSTYSAQVAIANSLTAQDKRETIKEQREGLKTEFEMLRQLEDLDGAKKCLRR